VLRKRERRLLSRISAATKLLKDHKAKGEVELSIDRVQSLHEMVRSAEMSMDAILNLGDVDFAPWRRFDEGAEPEA
jgi:hypothetical protein